MQNLVQSCDEYTSSVIDYLDARDLVSMPQRVQSYLALRVSTHTQESSLAVHPAVMLREQDLADYYFAGLMQFCLIYWQIPEL